MCEFFHVNGIVSCPIFQEDSSSLWKKYPEYMSIINLLKF